MNLKVLFMCPVHTSGVWMIRKNKVVLGGQSWVKLKELIGDSQLVTEGAKPISS